MQKKEKPRKITLKSIKDYAAFLQEQEKSTATIQKYIHDLTERVTNAFPCCCKQSVRQVSACLNCSISPLRRSIAVERKLIVKASNGLYFFLKSCVVC